VPPPIETEKNEWTVWHPTRDTAELAILGSIEECDSTAEYLDRIKSQFTGSSKTYATQLIQQLVTQRYNGGGIIRDLILKMSNMASKLKSLDLELKPAFLVHLISLPCQKNLKPLLLTTTCSQNSGTWKSALRCACKRRKV
jgi:hypothetical protein